MSKLCKEIITRLKTQNSHLTPFLSILNASLLKQISDDKFSLELPSSLYKERVEKNYLPFFKKEISRLYGKEVTLMVHVSSFVPNMKKKRLITPRKEKKPPRSPHLFNPSFSFKNFVSGSSNSLVLQMFKDLSLNPFSYSSVFVYGKTGSGKTHLLHSLGKEIFKTHPEVHLRYLSGERFLQDCVSSIRLQKVEGFQKEFREKCQVLLIDDIQEIEKGLRSQEEFFHAFNSILNRNGLVVCASEKKPAEIKGFQPRIQTRLCGGVVLKINPLTPQVRKDFISLKASQKQIHLSSPVIDFIAEQSESISNRELEGWLNKIKMVCDLGKGKPSLAVVRDTLSSHISPFSQTPQGFIQHIARKNGLSVEKLVSSSRTKSVVFVRNQAMLLVHQKFPYLSLSKIGNLFGRRTHSTVLHALKKACSCKKSIYK